MTVSAGTKTFENLKLENYTDPISIRLSWYLHHFITFCLLIYWKRKVSVMCCVGESTSKKKKKKKPGIYQNLYFNITKKNFIKCYKTEDFSPAFHNTFTANILRIRERSGGFTSHAWVLLPSEPVAQHRCMSLPKTDDNDRTYKNDANTLSWHMVNTSFWTNAL